MAELKTQQTEASVEDFLNTIQDEDTRRDCFEIAKIMRQVTHADPKMWGASIIGFGSHRLKYASGRELDWMLTGFAPRKANIALYLMGNFEKRGALLKKLGKHSTGKGCLYIKRLKDVDMKVLKELVSESVQTVKKSDK
ncbi:hypothetical protein TFLX_01580 [Thermoflexales bacterium]|nr:hypothetical protein TFLX_01580 [Thermoflexales bacterium]